MSSYPSIADAAKTLGVKRNALQSALDDVSRLSCGYLWTTIPNENIRYTPTETYSFYRPIQKLDVDGNVIKEWKTVTDAAKEFNTSTKQIRRLIKRGELKYKE